MEDAERKRTIRAVYYNGKKDPVATNFGKWPRTMTLHALDHLQTDNYGARACEIFDIETGTLHAVLSRTLYRVEVIFKRNPTEHFEPRKVEKE